MRTHSVKPVGRVIPKRVGLGTRPGNLLDWRKIIQAATVTRRRSQARGFSMPMGVSDEVIHVECVVQPARIAERKSSLGLGERKYPRTCHQEEGNQRQCGTRRRSFPTTGR